MENKKKSNVLGIIGLCTGWLVPLAGLVLGILALTRKEKNKAIGIISLIEAVLFWAIWTLSYL